MSGQGSMLGGLSKSIQSNTLLSQGVAGNAFAPFESGKPRQAFVDPLNIYGGNNPPPAAAPTPPVVEQPSAAAPLPAIGDRQTEAARRKALEDQALQRGRAATILTSDSGGKLGS